MTPWKLETLGGGEEEGMDLDAVEAGGTEIKPLEKPSEAEGKGGVMTRPSSKPTPHPTLQCSAVDLTPPTLD